MIQYVLAAVAFVVAAVVFFPLGIVYRKKISEKEISSAEEEARRIINEAIKSSESKKREALVEAKEEILRSRSEYEKEEKSRRADLQKQERRLQQKEENLDRKTENIERKEEALNQKHAEADMRCGKKTAHRAQPERPGGAGSADVPDGGDRCDLGAAETADCHRNRQGGMLRSNHHAGIYPSAARTAGHIRAPSHGVCHDVPAGYGTACGLPQTDGGLPHRLLRTGGTHLPHRPESGSGGARFFLRLRKQHGRGE